VAENSFGSRLSATFAESGQLCVGIDPHPFLLDQWDQPDSAEGLREFGYRVIDAVSGRAGIVKPQVAFFERHGSAGYAALEAVLRRARSAGLVIIADVKRGDVGSTVEAYGQAWLSPGNSLEADAMTISAYQGVGSLRAPVALAEEAGKGLFVLAATSNPESFDTQQAKVERGTHAGMTVAAAIVAGVTEINSAQQTEVASCGVVLGATVSLETYGISLDAMAAKPATPILAPGFGFQGAQFSEIRSRFGAASRNVVVASSRGILGAGVNGIAEMITRTSGELYECLA